jgi:hypothetical protein
MKWSELKRKAIKNGWQLERHGRNHDISVTLKKISEFKLNVMDLLK